MAVPVCIRHYRDIVRTNITPALLSIHYLLISKKDNYVNIN